MGAAYCLNLQQKEMHMGNGIDVDEDSIGEESFRVLLDDLLKGDALEVVCIVPRSSGSIDRIRFFTDDQGLLRRSLL